MKRSALARRTPLRARRRRPVTLVGREAWKTPRKGYCAVCGTHGLVFRHHILYERKVIEAGHPELVYDLRNALDIGADATCSCHHDHHHALRNGQPWRIPRRLISLEAERFAAEVLGEGPARVFFQRFYA